MGNLFSERQKLKTNLSLPTFGMGTAHLGELYGRVEENIYRPPFEAAWGRKLIFRHRWYARLP